MKSINVVIDDATDLNVSSIDNEENSSVPPFVNTDVPNIPFNMSSNMISETLVEDN